MEQVQNFAQAYKQAPWRKQWQMIGVFLLVVVFSALVVSLYLNVTARAGEVGREIVRIQDETEKIEQVNEDIRSQIAFQTSASHMAQRARSLGFQPKDSETALYMVIEGYQERQPVILAPLHNPAAVQRSMLPVEYSESLFEWLQRQSFQPPFPVTELLP